MASQFLVKKLTWKMWIWGCKCLEISAN